MVTDERISGESLDVFKDGLKRIDEMGLKCNDIIKCKDIGDYTFVFEIDDIRFICIRLFGDSWYLKGRFYKNIDDMLLALNMTMPIGHIKEVLETGLEEITYPK